MCILVENRNQFLFWLESFLIVLDSSYIFPLNTKVYSKSSRRATRNYSLLDLCTFPCFLLLPSLYIHAASLSIWTQSRKPSRNYSLRYISRVEEITQPGAEFCCETYMSTQKIEERSRPNGKQMSTNANKKPWTVHEAWYHGNMSTKHRNRLLTQDLVEANEATVKTSEDLRTANWERVHTRMKLYANHDY